MATTDQPTDQAQQGYGTAYHMGSSSLIQFRSLTGEPTPQIWLLDNKKKEMRPFASQQAFLDAYAGNVDAAKEAITIRGAQDRAPGGILADYEILDPEYAIQSNGTYKKTDVSKAELSSTYGRPTTDYATRDKIVDIVGGFLSSLQKENSGISSSFIDTVRNNPKLVAKYINAAIYGGYQLSDIYRDLKRKELGDTTGGAVSPISASVVRDEYIKTNEGYSAATSVATKPPMQLGGLDPNIMNYPIYSLPDEAFATLVQPLKEGSPEMRAAMEKIQASAYDIAIKQMEASTNSEKAVADANWQKFKTETERTLGIKLSNNSIDAWKQIESAKESFSTRGIEGSGLQNENVDDYLRSVRRADQETRTSTINDVDAKKAAYYRSSASSAEIAALSPEERQKYGLNVSDSLKQSMSVETLKRLYPDLTDEQIGRLRSSVFDENGNVRSTLYQNQVTKNLETTKNKEDYQVEKARKVAANAAKKAGKQFTDPALTEGGVFVGDTDTSKLPKDTSVIPKLSTTTPQGDPVGLTPEQQQANIYKASGLTSEQIANVKAGKPSTGSATANAVTQYSGGLAPGDTRNMFNTETGERNLNYKAPTETLGGGNGKGLPKGYQNLKTKNTTLTTIPKIGPQQLIGPKQVSTAPVKKVAVTPTPAPAAPKPGLFSSVWSKTKRAFGN